ncbi:IS3 family transposase [Photobacterium leiognathi]|uniref:IS3 family transposase n=1 Tax=Photobacterium leiognathi TaxID=553611 RepID=UPI0029818D09|nr:IS3 family transposase [Photobacterium leiognathi]
MKLAAIKPSLNPYYFFDFATEVRVIIKKKFKFTTTLKSLPCNSIDSPLTEFEYFDTDVHIEKIEEYINTKRIKIKLKGLTPLEYRNQALQSA